MLLTLIEEARQKLEDTAQVFEMVSSNTSLTSEQETTMLDIAQDIRNGYFDSAEQLAKEIEKELALRNS